MSEKSFPGRSVSRGIGLGTALCLYGRKRQFYRSQVEPGSIESEIERLRKAFDAAADQLTAIVGSSESSKEAAEIFETHLMFLRDRNFVGKIEQMISIQFVNSEWAVNESVDEFVSKYKLLTDRHLREKYIDLLDVGERIVAALGGGNSVKFEFESPTVFVAKEINPSTLIEIAGNKPAALVTEFGGWTSHTFILARELGIPAVTGIKDLLRHTETGDSVLVDGESGMVFINPVSGTIKRYGVGVSVDKEIETRDVELAPTVLTKDGVEILLSANLDLSREPEKLERIKDLGIGLYRSEYLFRHSSGYPTEIKQIERYKRVFEIAGGANCRIRTFDLSVGEIVGRHGSAEKNPALGLRGIRLALRDGIQFRTQIRALLIAGAGRSFDIVLPFVSDVSEIDEARSVIDEEIEKLVFEGLQAGHPRIGAMVEVPSAVLMVHEILEKTSFINIGTNDLVQYLLAADRDNDDVANNFRTVHPAVIRALRIVLDAANQAGKEAIVCGEMAGSPLYIPLLVGLGARSLSMNLNSMPRVARVLSAITVSEASEIARAVERSKTSEDAEKLLRESYRNKWPEQEDISFPFPAEESE